MTGEIRSGEEPNAFGSLEVSTAAFLHDPRRLFQIIHELNSGRPDDGQYGIEVYPMRRRLDLPVVGRVESVTVDQVRAWQDDCPQARVSRVHLPFSHNRRDAFHRAFGRTGEPPRHRILRIADLAIGTGAATSERGFVLAAALAEDQETTVAVHGHPNVIAGFDNEGKLAELQERLKAANVTPILVENEHAFRTPILSPDRISNPLTIRDDVLNRYHAGGMLLGLDHLATEGKTPKQIEAILEATKDVVRAVHIAGPEHAPLDFTNERTVRLLRVLAATAFASPVSIVLDYSPKSMRGLSYDQQQRQIADALSAIERAGRK